MTSPQIPHLDHLDIPLVGETHNKNLERVRELLKCGADVNGHKGEGWTALHAAAYENVAEVAKLLIANGAEVNAILNERASGWGPGWTPLDCAILKEHSGMQSLLRQHGGRCNKKCGRADKFGATQPRICLNSVAHCI